MLEIDLATTVPPFDFETAFRAAYTSTGVRRFVSRSIIVVQGAGTLVLEDAEGHSVSSTLALKEVREFEAVGVVSASGVTKICVML
ncbi:MAG: hypothetical protein K0Q89_852 [Thermomicrobiales bacterium]|jgi:hypothetical protein|nr:hypothetical protein [Thermomicrobiales bacterium]